MLLNNIRYTQPQGAVEIDWSNPISRGLAFCVSNGVNYLNAGNITKTNTSKTVTDKGVSDRFVFNTNDSAIAVAGNYTTSYLTQLVIGKLHSGSPPGPMGVFGVSGVPGSTTVAGGFIKHVSGDFWRFSILDPGGQKNAVDTSTTSKDKSDLIIGVANGSNVRLFRDGVLKATAAAGIVANGVSSLSIGTSGNSQSFDGSTSLACQWNRALSDAEIASISANPYQLFKPYNRQIWVPVSAGAGGTSQTIAFTLDSLTASISQTLSHSQSAVFTLDSISSTVNQAVTHSQSLSATLDDVAASISQTASPAKSQSVSFVLEGISASITQVVGSGNFQNISFTLDGISSSVSQTLVHSQTSSFSLEDVSVSVSQTARHGQALAISLEDVSIGIAQSVATSKQQTLSITLDGVSVAINQAAPSSPLTDAEMRDMYDKVLLIYANMLTVPKFLALK